MLGQAFMRQLVRRGGAPVGVARSGAELCLDLTDHRQVTQAMDALRPSLIVNCAAMVSLAQCEASPDKAMAINAVFPGFLARYARDRDVSFIHISTDHYYTGDGPLLHDEDAPVSVVNEYARSKFSGEKLAKEGKALIIRTNVTGWRGRAQQPTFFEWVADSLRNRLPMTAYTDYFTSTMDADSCARAALDLSLGGHSGLFNVASRDCKSKRDFIYTTASILGIEADWVEAGSVATLDTLRAESCGLDVSRAERVLGRLLPTTKQAIESLVDKEREYRGL